MTTNAQSVIDLDTLVKDGCRAQATQSTGTADEMTDEWKRARVQCLVARGWLIPLSPEGEARIRALLACESEVGAVAPSEVRIQRVRQCMAKHGYPPDPRVPE